MPNPAYATGSFLYCSGTVTRSNWVTNVSPPDSIHMSFEPVMLHYMERGILFFLLFVVRDSNLFVSPDIVYIQV